MASGRLICSRCGSNNFDTQAACWKCGAPLAAGAAAPAAAAAATPPAAVVPPRGGAAAPAGATPPRRAGAAPLHAPAAAAPAAAAPVRPRPSVDPAVANWTGILSGLLLPYFMLPIALAFMMLDDRRKLEVGRITLIASLVGSLIHFFVTLLALMPVYQMFNRIIRPVLTGDRSPAAAQSAPAPNWNEQVEPLHLPGLSPAVPPR